jgi:hypothetical protein
MYGKKRKQSTENGADEPAKKRKRVSSVASTEGPITRRMSHDQAETAIKHAKVEATVFKRIDPSKF